MICAGLDVGHLTAKAVVMRDGAIVGKGVIVSHDEADAAARNALQAATEDSGIALDDIQAIIATGVGRKFVSFAHNQKSTALCLAKGVNIVYPDARTIFDVGAESSTVVRVNQRGILEDTIGHDHCASGTGMFLETMAKLLQMPLVEMAQASLNGAQRAEVSSMCAVFAEQEVISHVHRVPPTPRDELIKGIYGSMAVRIAGLAKRLGIKQEVVIVGGVAHNAGLVHELETEIKGKIVVLPDPQLVAALGAARIAQEGK